MSFLLDPPSLLVIGVVLNRYVQSATRRVRLATGVVVLFLIKSTLLYFNLVPWWFSDANGTQWMLNSGLDTNLTRQPGTDILAAIMFAAYPLWMKLGLDIDLP
jgi:hypothetical protein